MPKEWHHSQTRMDRAEALVTEALSDFRVVGYEDPKDLPPEVVFTPTHVLYDVYLKWLPANAPGATPLNETYFGRALRRALGLDEALKQFRRYRGKRCWGYVGVRGPGSVMASSKAGRPKNASRKTTDKTPSPAA